MASIDTLQWLIHLRLLAGLTVLLLCPLPLAADGPDRCEAMCVACYQLALQQLCVEAAPDPGLATQVGQGHCHKEGLPDERSDLK